MLQRYREIVQRIESRRDRPGTAGGFESVAAAFRELPAHAPRDGQKVVIVAGTNGKGSVVKSLEAMLTSAGERVGAYTSPHLIEITERIRVGGRDLSPAEFVATYERVESVATAHGLGRFEILTAMAIDAFFSGAVVKPVTAAIFEVGVGGRLDCVNAIPRVVAAIARLGLDHEAILGGSLGAIATEKFAVGTTAKTTVYLPLEAAAKPALESATRASAPGGVWREASVYPLADVVFDEARQEPRFAIETPWGRAPLTLPGLRAAENASLAIAAFQAMGFDPGPHLEALAHVEWPGRMERMPARCPRGFAYLSGDHNPQGARSLVELLRYWRYERLLLLVGIGEGKNAHAILDELERIPRVSVRLTTPPFRGAEREAYDRPDAPYEADPARAFETLEAEARDGDLIVVTGSLYLVGAIRQALLARSG